MRLLTVLLFAGLILVLTPHASFAAEEAPATHEHAMASADEASSSVTLQEVAWGTAVLGSAFAVGAVAGGSLATGLVAAGAVVIVYSFLP